MRLHFNNFRHAKYWFRHGDRELNRLSVSLLATSFDVLQFWTDGAVPEVQALPRQKRDRTLITVITPDETPTAVRRPPSQRRLTHRKRVDFDRRVRGAITRKPVRMAARTSACERGQSQTTVGPLPRSRVSASTARNSWRLATRQVANLALASWATEVVNRSKSSSVREADKRLAVFTHAMRQTSRMADEVGSCLRRHQIVGLRRRTDSCQTS